MTDREYRPPEGVEPLLEVDPVAVRVRFECRETGHWLQPRIWQPVAVEPGEADLDPAVHLHLDECEGYYLNLTTEEPSLFVQWRLREDDTGIVVDGDATPPRALAVTASYNEAGRWMDGGARVDRVPMPGEMASWVAQFVSLHYVAEPTKKKRNAAKPSFLPRDQFGEMIEHERAAMRAKEGGRGERDTHGPGGTHDRRR
ncbi:MAG: DUF3305 domain-containing protein [Burkholderiaceae bacterium]|nr:DUF3305 domain-containing protein [Burkholderiaceae bacterium]